MNGRRGFIRGLGLVGTIIGGFAAARATDAVAMVGSTDTVDSAIIDESPASIAQLAPPTDDQMLRLTGAYGPPEEPVPPVFESNRFYIGSTNRTVTHSVGMAVGKDNHLWIKIGDGWKRVVVEG